MARSSNLIQSKLFQNNHTIQSYTIMTPTERKLAWTLLPFPKPEWETFKRMLPVCSNNPEVVLTKWRSKKLNADFANATEDDYTDIDDKEHAEDLQLKASIIEVAIEIVNEMVFEGLLPNCTDTDDETEFQAQDIIREKLLKHTHKSTN